MSKDARRKARRAGEKNGARREKGRTPRSHKINMRGADWRNANDDRPRVTRGNNVSQETAMTHTTTEPVADQYASGVTADREQWSIARYGTQVVVNIDGESNDGQYPTEAQAIDEFHGVLEQLSVTRG